MNKTKLMKHTKDYQLSLLESLADPREASCYLQVALEEYEEDGDDKAFLIALRNVTQARGGFSELAKKTHLNRQSLYRTLSTKGNPRLDTLSALLHALGFRLSIQPAI